MAGGIEGIGKGLTEVRKKLIEDIKTGGNQLKAGYAPSFAQNFEIGNRLGTGQVRTSQGTNSTVSL